MQTALAEAREYGVVGLKGDFAGARLDGLRKINGPRPLVERDHEWIRFTADLVATVKPS